MGQWLFMARIQRALLSVSDKTGIVETRLRPLPIRVEIIFQEKELSAC